MSKILIVGCGDLGSRHLQAIGSLSGIKDVYIVDPKEESLDLGIKRLWQVVDPNPRTNFHWSYSITDVAKKGDLCIVATQAKGRCSLIKEIVNKYGYKKFLIEKIVSQSVAEYEDLMSFADEKKVSIWVNCKTRAYGIHQYIHRYLDKNDAIVFNSVGGNHGLACNGVHTADIFAFHDGAKEIIKTHECIIPKLFPTKRGEFDLCGTLRGKSEKGSIFSLTFTKGNNAAELITIFSLKCRFIIDHFQGFFYEANEPDWKWKYVVMDEDRRVSHMSKVFVREIIDNSTCILPTLQECYVAHKFILDSLLPHFNKLLDKDDDICPVT